MKHHGPFTPGLTPCHQKCGQCPPEPFVPETKVCNQHCYPNQRVLSPKTPPPRPTGYIKENQFRIVNGYPYITDPSAIVYGAPFRASEGLETRVVQKPDASGISIDAVLDCTNSTNTNFTLLNYLVKVIGAQHDSLQGILPIIKKDLTFRINYYVTDINGEVISDTFRTQAFHEGHLHPTEIRDFYVESFKNMFIIELPDFEQYGDQTCTLTITNMEIFGEVIDTFEHLENPELNDFYAYHENYTKMVLNEDKINITEGDGTILLATCDINKSFYFKAAVTTRFKFKYTAYMSDFIMTHNTFNVWSELVIPTDAVVNELKVKVDTLDTKVTELTAENTELRNTILELQDKVAENTEKLAVLDTINEKYDAVIAELETLDQRVSRLENPNDTTPSEPDPDDEQDP